MSRRARYGIITVGGCKRAVLEARDRLKKKGIAVDYMRVRAFPFHEDVAAFAASHELTFVVEQNRDAQLRTLLMVEAGVPAERLASVRVYGGQPLAAGEVVEGILEQLDRVTKQAAGGAA